MRCRGSGASVSPRFEGRVRRTLVFRRFGSAAEGAVRVSVYIGPIGFERWMKHTSRSSGPSVFNGFEGRVRHTLASHSGPS